jgi:glycosyltransferase involved in cell wall biosynthesis
MSNKISVLLPVFNGEKTVLSAVKSIQAQTIPNWELIIVDDGSSDNSYQICASEAQKDQRIKLYRNPQNLGLAKTMNKLVALARGKYIAIQEQDDRSIVDRLEKEANFLDSNPEFGIVSGIAIWVDKDDEVIGQFPGLLIHGGQYPSEPNDMVRYLYVEQSKVVNAACMIRRSVLDKIEGPFDPDARMAVDWQFFVHAAHFTKIWGIPEVLVYMLRDKSHSHLTQQKKLQFSESRRCLRVLLEQYRNDPNSPIDKKLFRRAMITELVLESKTYSRVKGFFLLIESLFYGGLNSAKVAKLSKWYFNKALKKIGITALQK